MPSTSDQEIIFFINGKKHTVPANLPATTRLSEYVRDVAGLKGTKVMCQEAGCGSCAVTVTHAFPDSGKVETYSIQSCVTPLYVVDGWQITTVEGLGSQRKGFHPVQERIAKFNGSQCGFCTPGMVMNMYGLLHKQPNITAQEIEDNFDGNLCRCTGYRSILDAMKSFSNDGNIPESKIIDIEDLNKHLCPKTGDPCMDDKGGFRSLDLDPCSHKWLRPASLDDVSSLLKTNKNRKVKFVFGNTATGIYKDEESFDIWIDLHQVKQLYKLELKCNSVSFGACTTLTNFISKLKIHQDKPGYQYFSAIIQHLKSVGNVLVRNAGSIAGNLMIKHTNPDFPSDLFTVCEAAGAQVELYDSETSTFITKTLPRFLKIDMKGKVVYALELPKLETCPVFRTFKVTPRWQNSHAYVNAAFKIPCIDKAISDQPSIVYGGINGELNHAHKTEEFLTGKTLSDSVVKEALKTLKDEMKPTSEPYLSSPKFRQELAISLLYKVLLEIYKPDNLRLMSASSTLQRPISTAFQSYQEIKKEFPLKKPLTKITAPLQASGEAQFVNDIPNFQHELFGAFVLGDHGNAVLESVDPTEALKMPGVVRFISAGDIPEEGDNNYMPAGGLVNSDPQEVFSTKEINYAGQSVGLILAETQAQAFSGAKKVKIKYSEIHKPILTIEESIEAGKEYGGPMTEHVTGEPDNAWKTVERIITGEVQMGSQYHFFLENHISLANPSEDGIDLYTSTQYADMTQHAAATIIGKPMNYINCVVPRLGGAFGGKTTDSGSCAAAATLAAYVTERPVRVLMDLSNVMTMCGKRPPFLCKYKVGCSNSGDVVVVEMDYYVDCGHTKTTVSDVIIHLAYLDMGYHIPNWKIRPHSMMTNKQTPSLARAPGAVPAALVIESIMEHVSFELNKHSILVKEINLYEEGQSDHFGNKLEYCTLRKVWQRLKDTAEVEERMKQVEAFNKENFWKKRGLTMTASKYGIIYLGPGFPANVSIFGRDGTVVVSQGGVEMGQGLYTKVAQGVAHALEVPLEIIKIRSNQTLIAPNASFTGCSITSESAMMSAIEASYILKERMQPIREKFPDLDWRELCKKCCENKIDLSAKHTYVPPKGNPFLNYISYSAGAIETEVDILTGENQIRRVDIMADVGESLNPTIDIGQIEGAFVMGLGAYLTEDIIFDEKSGCILNDGSWEYKPPTSKDIPIDWRIYLLPDTPNPYGVRGSKATGEPPITLSVGALFANKQAVLSVQKDMSCTKDFMVTVAPYTVEKVQQSVGLDIESLTI